MILVVVLYMTMRYLIPEQFDLCQNHAIWQEMRAVRVWGAGQDVEMRKILLALPTQTSSMQG